MTAAFGTPAPLPGQPGFGARPSECMARETAEMEARLARLKADLAAEEEMREAAGPRAGGSRWRSARTDRGSVRAYAKDVKVRYKQQLLQRPPHGIFATGGSSGGGTGLSGGKGQPQAGAGARAAAALRVEQQQRQQHYRQQQAQAETRRGGYDGESPTARPGFGSKEVSRWGVANTLEWLGSLGLEKYCGVFQQNEISGPILLEVGLDDLDYMDVRILAHRKRILKGIEDLRRGDERQRKVEDLPPPPDPTPPYVSNDSNNVSHDTSNRQHVEGEAQGGIIMSPTLSVAICQGGNQESRPAGGTKKHWSTIKPLCENQTEDDVNLGPSPAVNLADGQYDEAAAHSSFAEAVAEWRDEGRNMTKAHALSLHRPSMVGRAPLAGMPAGRPEEEASHGSKNKLGGKASGGIRRWLFGEEVGGGGGESNCWTNPFVSPRAGEEEAEAASEEFELLEPDPHPKSPPTRKRTATAVGVEQHGAARGVSENAGLPLDEEAEHAAFRRAVADWNRGQRASARAEEDGSGDGGASGRDNAGASVGRGTEDVGSSLCLGTEPLPARRTTESMAEELRQQMDADHRREAKELEEKKRALLAGLDAAAAAAAARPAITNAASGDHDFLRGEARLGGSIELAGVESPGRCGEGDKPEGEDTGDEDGNRGDASSTVSANGSTAAGDSPGWQEDDDEARLREGDVEIEIMESVLGAECTTVGVTSYVVDEGESGDES